MDPTRPFCSKRFGKKLNLKHWREYQCDQKMMIETALNKLKDINSSNISPFWEEQLRVIVAEGELLAGRKSRLHKFRIMIEKPEDVEVGLGIATEDDLKGSYWEAQIGPVVTDWSAKSNWLLRASELNFPETEKDSMPKTNIGQSPAKPRVKPIDHLGRRESEKDPEKAALAAKKKAEQKKKLLQRKRLQRRDAER
ncbi:Oidioi.mRNA.OKI2018_I69.XSR.g16917.t1.cds [Oikopleura dioica]|uniref:Oidioi.mRNA.OKI2018_I69.XSR.g16917.t1.cds n=1 Tax=Oikopleura dioica TaxID=34765 RepID=A0ABN7SRY5_OIKDI|nr:Oidioi.mRNA.OKI2018_I69.XSR.g16917.t1.cds [Oikopleura dioica]